MKKIVLLSAVAALFSATSNAAVSVTVTGFSSGSEGIALFNTNGTALSSSVTVGSFLGALPNFANATAAQIRDAFTVNSTNANTFTFSNGLVNTVVNNAATSTNSSDPFTSPEPNAKIYVLIGNNASLAASTQIMVFEGGLWPVEAEGIGGVATVQIRLNNLVAGTGTTTDAKLAAPFAGLQGVTFVPEPSIALLGALGAVGFLRRRR